MKLDWAVATVPLRGQTESGDLHLVQAFGGGILVAVVDALGHGPEAAVAARLAVDCLRGHPHEPLPLLLQRCHEALIGSRGAVVSLAAFDFQRHSMTWLGVGDVEGVLMFADPTAKPARTSLITRGGIVGAKIPPSRPWVIPLSHGDTLIFATDGVRRDFAQAPTPTGEPQKIADSILARNNKGTDDALVLVARYVNETPSTP